MLLILYGDYHNNPASEAKWVQANHHSESCYTSINLNHMPSKV